jgi:hypothetical protein
MTTRCLRRGLWFAAMLLLLLQGACVASQAPKVECDSYLRPINHTNPDKP